MERVEGETGSRAGRRPRTIEEEDEAVRKRTIPFGMATTTVDVDPAPLVAKRSYGCVGESAVPDTKAVKVQRMTNIPHGEMLFCLWFRPFFLLTSSLLALLFLCLLLKLMFIVVTESGTGNRVVRQGMEDGDGDGDVEGVAGRW